MTVHVRRLWPVPGEAPNPEPVDRICVIFGTSGLDSFVDLIATGRVIFHLEGGKLTRVESFDEGPSRRSPYNSKPKK